jgi:hypothetical protein
MEQEGLTNIGPNTWASWLSKKGSGVQDIRLHFQNGRNNNNNNNNSNNRISRFSVSAGKPSPIPECVINRITLGGLICNLKSFLQLNMFQELQIFAFVFTYSDAG